MKPETFKTIKTFSFPQQRGCSGFMFQVSRFKFQERGVSLYITIVILSLMVASVLTLSNILASQMKVIFNLGEAVTAFVAADAGAEQALHRVRGDPPDYNNFSEVFGNGSRCDVTVDSTPERTIIKSVGTYRAAQRAIEIRY